MDASSPPGGPGPDPKRAVYRRALEILLDRRIAFLVGGAFALRHYTGIARDTKDFDIFVRPTDLDRTLKTLAEAGYCTEVTFSHWLAKAIHGDDVMDVIFNSGNGMAEVDDAWFEHAPQGHVLGLPALISPAEEMIWSKAFIMERDRYDGADIMHILRAHAEQLDWQRLLERFGPNWRVLLTHLVLFGFIYPSERARIPSAVMDELLGRLRQEVAAGSSPEPICRGTLLSHSQYQTDLERWGYQDARLSPYGNMTGPEVERWTSAFAQK